MHNQSWRAMLKIRHILPVLALFAILLPTTGAIAADASAVHRVWVWSDSHIGRCDASSGNRDGVAWLQDAATDVSAHAGGPIAWMISLGDITDSSNQAEFAKYADFRRHAGFRPCFEVAGNHDFTSTTNGLWKANMMPPQPHFVIEDGNGVWICVGVEHDGAAGRISEATLNWLRETIEHNQNRNIIVCTHQAVSGTVKGANKNSNVMSCPLPNDPDPPPNHPEEDVAWKRVTKIMKELRVDLWLNGHIHNAPHTIYSIDHKGATTYVNVASISPTYSNHPSSSFVLEFREGSRTVNVRYREHNSGKFDEKLSTTVEFPNAWHFSGPPKLLTTPP